MLIKLFKSLILLISILFLCALSAGYMLIDSDPIVGTDSVEQIDQAESVNELLDQLKLVTRRRFFQQRIVMKEEQLNSLVGLTQRALPAVAGKVDTTINAINLKLSYKLPLSFTDLYFNFDGNVLPSQGLKFGEVSFGSLTLSGDNARSVLIWLMNWRTSSKIGTLAVEQIKGVHLFPTQAVVVLKPIDKFLQALNEVRNGITGGGDEQLIARTRFYLDTLTNLTIRQHQPGRSLQEFIQPLFAVVSQKSEKSSAVLENQSALLALAIYTGHHRLANFVGEVQPVKGKVVMPRYRPLLAQRTDLTQHFVISAAIKILSQQGISLAIGEFKELMDRAKGGSGFSFADLAADMAGVKLAVMASNQDTAQLIQQQLAYTTTESAFFPQINDLQEGLSKQQFASEYGKLDSEMYLSKVKFISDRIEALPLYSVVLN